MDLLNATEDSSPCNSTPMNRAHALGVSVGEVAIEGLLLGCSVTVSLASQPYFSLFPVGGARGREKYFYSLIFFSPSHSSHRK